MSEKSIYQLTPIKFSLFVNNKICQLIGQLLPPFLKGQYINPISNINNPFLLSQ